MFSYVGRPGNSHGYIASQAPTDSTVSDFWRMIWEHGVHVVVALSNNTAEECARYWPWELNEAEEYGLVLSGSWVNEGFTVTMTSENPCNINNCVVRTFHLSSTIEQEQRTVKQFHYTGWPISGECTLTVWWGLPISGECIVTVWWGLPISGECTVTVWWGLPISGECTVTVWWGRVRTGVWCTIHQTVTTLIS